MNKIINNKKEVKTGRRKEETVLKVPNVDVL